MMLNTNSARQNLKSFLIKSLFSSSLILFSALNPSNSLSEEIPQTTLRLSKESVMEISGSATITDWTCESHSPVGEFVLPLTKADLDRVYEEILSPGIDPSQSTVDASNLLNKYNKNVTAFLNVKVKSFDCGNRLMESDMYAAIKADTYPQVRYRHFGLGVSQAKTVADKQAVSIVSFGLLELAGVKKNVSIKLTIEKLDSGKFLLSGHKNLKMSDFNVTPPTALFGLIKTSDNFKLTYALVAESMP